jgi:hypothetical protein
VGTYGRNFEFRVTPFGGQRGARFVLPADAPADLPIGAPVRVADGATPDINGLLPVALATGAQPPKEGLSGILVYEWAPAAFAGSDPYLTTYSDKDTAPRGRAVQVVSGDRIKVVFKNTVDRLYLNTREYPGRTIVAGMGDTPTLAVGDLLTPGAGTDVGGYWAETAVAADAWLVVEFVDAARQEVEARFVF